MTEQAILQAGIVTVNAGPVPTDGTITSMQIYTGNIATVRSEESVPRYYRQVQYPDGRIELQGGYSYGNAQEQGIRWEALPLVQVNEQGEEL